MKSKVLWALVALNVLLLVTLVFPTVRSNTAHAQAGGAIGDYIMIPGEVVGGSNAVVYIVDQRNHTLSGMALSINGRDLDIMQPIDLKRVYDAK